MKKLILILGAIILGVYIHTLIIGDSSSLKAASKGVMQQQLDVQKITP